MTSCLANGHRPYTAFDEPLSHAKQSKANKFIVDFCKKLIRFLMLFCVSISVVLGHLPGHVSHLAYCMMTSNYESP